MSLLKSSSQLSFSLSFSPFVSLWMLQSQFKISALCSNLQAAVPSGGIHSIISRDELGRSYLL